MHIDEFDINVLQNQGAFPVEYCIFVFMYILISLILRFVLVHLYFTNSANIFSIIALSLGLFAITMICLPMEMVVTSHAPVLVIEFGRMLMTAVICRMTSDNERCIEVKVWN